MPAISSLSPFLESNHPQSLSSSHLLSLSLNPHSHCPTQTIVFRNKPPNSPLFRTSSPPSFKSKPSLYYLRLPHCTTATDAAAADDNDDSSFLSYEESESGEGIRIEIKKTGNNSRRIVSSIGVDASLDVVWSILTDYERLADFIPGLAVSKLMEKRENFARLYQIGEQDLALGIKFKAKGVVDCCERDLEILPSGQKRDIEFKMIEGDFQVFEGKWLIEQCYKEGYDSEFTQDAEFRTTLSYIVDVKPKLWLPVRLVEGRLCSEIKVNLACIRDEAHRAICNPLSAQ